ncbi:MULTISPECIES: hypothetical protein [unclassified Acinetobacter]|uniref:hypothetical protein n=1 Tax=unclassified Acinetobacter TaxID=196816 RepID=UPI00244BDE40|nr:MULTISPECIES: hypothetical protein [unclassified Acinetobacter]MDH0032573.1 hypothetical protein [Acinetobacter sp. GD04021]MDH0885264.1 hypothetical protein [Acinetobacter sp. GD03873]MDH1084408.1 hypothetical protein [Acinetobacter sp. GD03983]MDH2188296.1 hypothetical protein [Acinetobacter sp. GD03645]MDH2203807.1 hypothetical protein [Acinetobacter sp. GD03647]
MLTKIYCYQHQQSQYLDLSQVDSIEVSDSEYGRGGYTYGKSEYSNVSVGLKSGHTLHLTIKNSSIPELAGLEQDKS